MTPLQSLASRLGVQLTYQDVTGQHREAPEETLQAVLGAMGWDATSDAAVQDGLAQLDATHAARTVPPYMIAPPGAEFAIPDGVDWVLQAEDGTHREGRGPVAELPLGIHRLELADQVVTLLSAPSTLDLPARGWGVTLPLYGLWTDLQSGIGTYADLAAAATAIASAGAGFLGINPIHAGFPGDPKAISPYTPTHRRRLATRHLSGSGETQGGDLIDYSAAEAALWAHLEDRFAQGVDKGFFAFRTREGKALTRFATHQAISERHGPYWDSWPEALKDPSSGEVAAFAEARADRVTFHAWLQYLAETELGAAARTAQDAGMAHGLYLDLAVGTHPFGAETWEDRAGFAQGVSLGAPPDAFSENGQMWMLAPMDPHALIADGFQRLALTLRKQFQFARLLRIDHILGFDRAFWVPMTGGPGAYVTMPKDAMLAVARIEAARAGGAIVGEDLGNIPDGLQTDLAASGILGCRVAMFEAGPDGARRPEDYTEQAMASFGTHDLPTYAGWRAGADIGLRESLGAMDWDAAEWARGERRATVGALDGVAGGSDAVAMHGMLARTASRLVAVQIEDALGLQEQSNLPGTTDEYPNWRRRLPVGTSGLAHALQEIAVVMAAKGR